MRAAVDDSTRRIPISRCSVPTYWCSIDSASWAAYARIFFDSSESGSSADEEMRSTKRRSPSTSRRICSGFTLKREKISLMISSPSRRTPRRMCSDSMTREPSFEASYRAKKSARRAFSLYFSNMGVGSSLTPAASAHLEDTIAARSQITIVCDDHGRQTSLAVTFPHQIKDLLTRFEIEIAGRFVSEKQERIRQQRARDRHALLLAAGELIREVTRAPFESQFRQKRSGSR